MHLFVSRSNIIEFQVYCGSGIETIYYRCQSIFLQNSKSTAEAEIVNSQQSTDFGFEAESLIFAVNPAALEKSRQEILSLKRLRQKCCLSEASLFLSSENDKILADLSAAASFFCFSFLREKRERFSTAEALSAY